MTDNEIRVWAPDAKRVDVDIEPLGGVVTTTPMTRQPRGWWGVTTDRTTPSTTPSGSTAGAPLPDPRSPWQPRGVHGPSRTFDATAHVVDATAAGPARAAGRERSAACSTSCTSGTFTSGGTLDAATSRLDHLVALGVDVVELMPVAAFPGRRGWGYDGVDLYAVHDPYGGPAALAAVRRRLPPARASASASTSSTTTSARAGTTWRTFGPYFTDRHMTPWGPAVNLDGPGSDEVRRFVIDNALRWFRDFHLDALRLDAVHELRDDSPRHLLAELSDEVAVLAGAARPPADPGRRERPQRPGRRRRRRAAAAGG